MNEFLNSYGKSKVRVGRIVREPNRHDFIEMEVSVQLGGNFDAAFVHGRNDETVATDTVKNLVYVFARTNAILTPESFGDKYAQFILNEYPQIESVEVVCERVPWTRATIQCEPHMHTFTSGAPTMISQTHNSRVGRPQAIAGFSGLRVLKTTGSSFSGFYRDKYTTLPETNDRIMATSVDVTWPIEPGTEIGRQREAMVNMFIHSFGLHPSPSIQNTLYVAARDMFSLFPEIPSITFKAPNMHYIPFDLTRFDFPATNEVFVATSEPHGMFYKTFEREKMGAL